MNDRPGISGNPAMEAVCKKQRSHKTMRGDVNFCPCSLRVTGTIEKAEDKENPYFRNSSQNRIFDTNVGKNTLLCPAFKKLTPRPP
jgi:hypothetical protein